LFQTHTSGYYWSYMAFRLWTLHWGTWNQFWHFQPQRRSWSWTWTTHMHENHQAYEVLHQVPAACHTCQVGWTQHFCCKHTMVSPNILKPDMLHHSKPNTLIGLCGLAQAIDAHYWECKAKISTKPVTWILQHKTQQQTKPKTWLPFWKQLLTVKTTLAWHRQRKYFWAEGTHLWPPTETRQRQQTDTSGKSMHLDNKLCLFCGTSGISQRIAWKQHPLRPILPKPTGELHILQLGSQERLSSHLDSHNSSMHWSPLCKTVSSSTHPLLQTPRPPAPHCIQHIPTKLILGVWRSGCVEDENCFTQGRSMQYLSCVKSRWLLSLSWIQAGECGVLLFGFGRMGLRGCCFQAILCDMPWGATEKTKLVVQMALIFLKCQFAVFA